jgi:hypothetical protein
MQARSSTAFWVRFTAVATTVGSLIAVMGAFVVPLIVLLVDDNTPSSTLYAALLGATGLVAGIVSAWFACSDPRAQAYARSRPFLSVVPAVVLLALMIGSAQLAILARLVGDMSRQTWIALAVLLLSWAALGALVSTSKRREAGTSFTDHPTSRRDAVFQAVMLVGALAAIGYYIVHPGRDELADQLTADLPTPSPVAFPTPTVRHDIVGATAKLLFREMRQLAPESARTIEAYHRGHGSYPDQGWLEQRYLSELTPGHGDAFSFCLTAPGTHDWVAYSTAKHAVVASGAHGDCMVPGAAALRRSAR